MALLTDRAAIEAHRLDRSGFTPAGAPVAVVLAETVDDVRSVLADASRSGTPVVPRGAGTGLAGGAAAGAGSIVLDVSRLNRIVEISAADELAVVEPGVVTAELDRAAAGVGLRYAPDPASAEISTVGGNIATNAGGLRCAKYGVTRDAVLGLDVVLADGRLVSTGRRTVKGVAGYDLTGLFVGSEGTLGVIVGATLRLRPRSPGTTTIAASFPDLATAAQAVLAVTAAGVRPAVAELLDAETCAAVAAFRGRPAAGTGALLIVQTDGLGHDREADLVTAALAPFASFASSAPFASSAGSVRRAADEAEAADLLADRRLALPALERLGRPLIEDIAVPRSRLAEAMTAVGAIAAAHGVRIPTFAHAADGNIHPIILLGDGPDALAAEKAADEIFALALRLGGTVTGEHGVGVLKRRWLAAELGETALDLHHRLKRVLDPGEILNPGKAI